jgi:hypothetical protein
VGLFLKIDFRNAGNSAPVASFANRLFFFNALSTKPYVVAACAVYDSVPERKEWPF